MPKKETLFLLLIFSIIFRLSLKAQYVNTDSLVTLPGYSQMLTISEFNAMVKHETRLKPPYLSEFLLPGNGGAIISHYGPRSGRMHYGTDLKMQKGDTVLAVNDGYVTRAGWGSGFGNLMIIQHENNIETYYAHLSEFLKDKGVWVSKGEPIGLAGSTGRARGSHLHFEIHENDQAFDPELVFDFETQQIRTEASFEETLVALHRKLKPKGYSKNIAVPEFYRVRSGDSLWVISRKFKMPIKEICQLNQISENSVLQVGQPLKMF